MGAEPVNLTTLWRKQRKHAKLHPTAAHRAKFGAGDPYACLPLCGGQRSGMNPALGDAWTPDLSRINFDH